MNKWLAKYDGLGRREKLLAIVTVVAVVYMLFTFLVFSPLDQRQAVHEATLQTQAQKTERLNAELTVFSRLLSSDPDQQKRQQIKSIEAQLLQLDTSLSRLSVGLIPAAELPLLLQDVLKRVDKLTLTRLETLPVTELSLQGEVVVKSAEPEGQFEDADGATIAARETAGVYKHAVVMSLSGQYFEVIKYIEALEELPWRLYWDSLGYEVAGYPTADIKLQVYTLSTDEGAFGG